LDVTDEEEFDFEKLPSSCVLVRDVHW